MIHFDIKPDNILINKSDNIKIADFGISKMMNKSQNFSKVGGTRMFLPPETWLEKVFKGGPVDVWALGVSFYFLAFGQYPFSSADMNVFNKLVETQEITFPDCDPQFRDLISKMTFKNPAERITLFEMMEHPYITKDGEFPLEKLDPVLHKIIVTKEDIENAITMKKLEVNFFAVSKMRA